MAPTVFAGLNYWAVLVAAASAFLVGGLWYSPVLFGRVWQRETGLTDAQLQAGSPARIFGVSFVLALLAAFALAALLGPGPSLARALQVAGLSGAAFVGTSFGINYLFEHKSLTLFLVNAGYNLAQFAVFGLILGLWP